MDQTINAVFLGEALGDFGLVFIDTSDKVVCNSDVESAAQPLARM
jgi:hypothetical protein